MSSGPSKTSLKQQLIRRKKKKQNKTTVSNLEEFDKIVCIIFSFCVNLTIQFKIRV